MKQAIFGYVLAQSHAYAYILVQFDPNEQSYMHFHVIIRFMVLVRDYTKMRDIYDFHHFYGKTRVI
jgi:hypothetical protein